MSCPRSQSYKLMESRFKLKPVRLQANAPCIKPQLPISPRPAILSLTNKLNLSHDSSSDNFR